MNTTTKIPRIKHPEIAKRYADKTSTLPELASEYGVSTKTIARIVRAHGVRQVAPPIKLTAEQKRRADLLHADGCPLTEIATTLGVHPNVLYRHGYRSPDRAFAYMIRALAPTLRELGI